MYRLPHAEDPTDDRRRERAEPHVSLRYSGNDRRFENSQRLQRMPRRQIDGMGHGCPKDMGGPLTLACSRVIEAAGNDDSDNTNTRFQIIWGVMHW